MSALRFEGSGAALAARGVRLSAGGGGGEVAGEQGEREGRTARGGPSRCWPWWSGGGSCGEGVGGLAWASGVGGVVWRRLGTSPAPSVLGLPRSGLSHAPASFRTAAALGGLRESRPSCGLRRFLSAPGQPASRGPWPELWTEASAV